MKFMLFVLPTIPGSVDERRRLQPIGRNTERYQAMLDELRRLVALAEEAGFDVFAMTEHHFHSEGYEASVAPLLIFADLAARTTRIRFAPLGLVLPAWDPLRAAEELAVLDQLTRGRVYAGFARGHQSRWVDVLGQKNRVTAAPMDGSTADYHNRRAFEDAVAIIKKAWTEPAVTHQGEFYQIPFPFENGIRHWPLADWTRRYGAPGEVDNEGVLRRVCVIPRPYQIPHPPLFQASTVSGATIRYAARNGLIPWVLISHPAEFRQLCRTYRDAAVTGGRRLGLGQQIGALRAVHFGDTEAEAVEHLRETTYASFRDYFGAFGFWEMFRTPEDAGRYPLSPYTVLPREEWTVDRMRRAKFALAGTPAQVLAEIEALHAVYGGGELEWFGWFFAQGLTSWKAAVRQIQFFAQHIIPRFRAPSSGGRGAARRTAGTRSSRSAPASAHEPASLDGLP
jgi:alkanesulfonate monooxygenase SsuD/methylene tetrahydromethanopterin reductase-like flavin-dependent oxidoreductase (luciferase family)